MPQVFLVRHAGSCRLDTEPSGDVIAQAGSRWSFGLFLIRWRESFLERAKQNALVQNPQRRFANAFEMRSEVNMWAAACAAVCVFDWSKIEGSLT